MARILIQNALVLATQDKNVGEIHNGDVLIDGEVIVEVGKNLSVCTDKIDEVIDASGHVVLPGLINTHHHLFQVLTRSLRGAQNTNLFKWLTYLYNVWKHITADDVFAGAEAGLSELLLSGCTTCFDHHYICPQHAAGDVFEAEVKAAENVGIRLYISRGGMNLGQSSGGLPPDSLIQSEEQILADSERVIERFHDPGQFSMCQVALAPCSPFSVSLELMRSVLTLARNKGVRVHTHLAETFDEEQFCVQKYNRRPVELMEDWGWVGPDVWFAHCVHVSKDEIHRLAETKTGVAHCPVSNLRLGAGIAPVPALLDAHVRVGLAVDGSASNDSSNLLRELQMCMLIHRVGTGVDAMPARRALYIATQGGADVLGREDIGSLSPGKAADITMFDLRGVEYAGALNDPVAALVFCGPGTRAGLVMVNGKIVVRCGHLVRADERVLAEKANRASYALLQRSGV